MKAIYEAVSPVKRPERVLQFGEGGFLRAFVDWQIDIVNEKTHFNGNVVVVQPLPQGMGDQLNAQKGLYTTVLRGLKDGKPTVETRTIKSISRCINPYTEFDEYIKCAENPDLRFVVSNTTEAGITYDPSVKLEDKPQASYPGKLTAFLYKRFQFFKGNPKKGLILIPCELSEDAGLNLRICILQHARDWHLGADFLNWFNNDCDVCSCLVDRIVPGYRPLMNKEENGKTQAENLCEKLGYEDKLLDSAELFHLWCIESATSHEKELPLVKAGCHVIWTPNMEFYHTRKVRILNGTHTMTVLAAYLAGLTYVQDCFKDKDVYKFMSDGVFNEIIPSIGGDQKQLVDYAHDVFERFQNPFNPHALMDISLNSVSKFWTRDLPSVTSYITNMGKVPSHLAFSMAALITFYNGKEVTKNEKGAPALQSTRLNGETYFNNDSLPVLEFFATLNKKTDSAAEKAKAVLSNVDFWKEDLTKYTGLEDAVAKALDTIQKKGMKDAIAEIANA
jgi:tagaturonate reductase